MHDVKSLLDARKEELLKLKEIKEKALEDVPKGALRINRSRQKVQYYIRNDPKDTHGKYIKEQDFDLARQLAQKDYDEKVLSSVQKEIKAIEKYNSLLPQKAAEDIYSDLNNERKKLIQPIILSDEEYIREWENVTYSGKEFRKDDPEFYTAKGERVRSKSEVIIADSLNREGIPYRYEYPTRLHGLGIVYPDFYVLKVKERRVLIWEHFGRMDDAEYAEKAVKKIVAYEKNGYILGENIIFTYETKGCPLNQKTIQLMIGKYLK